MFSGKIRTGQAAIAMIMIIMFTMGISLAKATGNWQNEISKAQYLGHVIRNTIPWRGNGQVDPETMEKMIKIMNNIRAQKNMIIQ